MDTYCATCGLPSHPEPCERPWGDAPAFCGWDGAWLGTHRPEACLRPSSPPLLAPAPPPRREGPMILRVRVRVRRERPTCPRCGGSVLGGSCLLCGEEREVVDLEREAALAADLAAARQACQSARRGRPPKVPLEARG